MREKTHTRAHTHVHKDEDYLHSDNYRHRVANTSRLSVDWIFAIAVQETSQPGQHDHDDADFYVFGGNCRCGWGE